MNYIERINEELKPQSGSNLKAVDLFAGCGGLALGFEAAGIHTTGFEMEADACATYRTNLNGDCHEVKLDVDTEYPEADIVIGGPPCQPFSVGGQQKGLNDSRDGFPIFVSAVERLQPKVFLFENVRGLLYRNKWYFDEIVERLSGLGYIVEAELLNAKHFGVPQNRERLIAVGHLGGFEFPTRESGTVTVGEALDPVPPSKPTDVERKLTESQDKYIAKYEKASCCKNPRDLHFDRPSRTLTCRNLAGATGDMHRIRLPDGSRRRVFTSEAARLQSFPDWYDFQGAENSVFYQIGNAVAPLFAYHLAKQVRACCESGDELDAGI